MKTVGGKGKNYQLRQSKNSWREIKTEVQDSQYITVQEKKGNV